MELFLPWILLNICQKVAFFKYVPVPVTLAVGGWGTKTETERKRERGRQRDRGVLSLWSACLILFNRFHPANYGDLNYFK